MRNYVKGIGWKIKTGLFLIAEYKDYAAVIRKNVSGIDALYDYVEPKDYSILANFLVAENSKFEKVLPAI